MEKSGFNNNDAAANDTYSKCYKRDKEGLNIHTTVSKQTYRLEHLVINYSMTQLVDSDLNYRNCMQMAIIV